VRPRMRDHPADESEQRPRVKRYYANHRAKVKARAAARRDADPVLEPAVDPVPNRWHTDITG
jgi:hypothetical protein